jgi:hypothetical protein
MHYRALSNHFMQHLVNCVSLMHTSHLYMPHCQLSCYMPLLLSLGFLKQIINMMQGSLLARSPLLVVGGSLVAGLLLGIFVQAP